MIILIHVLIAICSVIYTTYVLFSPSKAKLTVSYALVAATVISGTYLIVSMPSHIVSSCITGLVYLAVMLFEILGVRYRLAKKKI